jgi:hypothetical protein
MNKIYVIGHERVNRFLFQCFVSVERNNKILVGIYEVWLVFVMQFDLVYEALDGFPPFQNMQVEDVHICQSNKNASVSLILSRQDRSM